jgi:hypothetical protein
VALTGGAGGIRQVVYGVVILSMLSNIMNMVGVSAYYQTLVIGVVIILAVILDRLPTAAARYAKRPGRDARDPGACLPHARRQRRSRPCWSWETPVSPPLSRPVHAN